MKRIATLGSGFSFLVGVPVLLVLFRLTVGSTAFDRRLSAVA